VEGVWRLLLTETNGDPTISHIIEPTGIEYAMDDPLTRNLNNDR
jgi:hypothetical protein